MAAPECASESAEPMLAAALLLASLSATPPPRVAVVLEAEGPERARATLTQALQASLTRDLGAVVPELAQLGALRALAERGALSSDRLPEAVTSADADLVVTGRLDLEAAGEPALGLYAVTAVVRLRAFGTDDGALLATAEATAQAPASSSPLAAEQASLRRVAELAWARLRPGLTAAREPSRVEVEVRTKSGLGTADLAGVTEALRSLDGVASARVRRRTRARAQIDLFGPALDAERLALALDVAADAGLVVERFSARFLGLRFEPGKAGRLKLRVRSIDGPTSSELTQEMMTGPVLGLDFVRSDDDAELELAPSLRRTPGGHFARLELRRGKKVLARSATTCPDRRALPTCLDQVGRAAAAELRALRADGSLGLTDPEPELRAGALETTGLFPALLGRYARHPVGALVVENRGERPATVLARAVLDGYSAAPRDGEATVVPPGGSARVSVLLALDAERVAAVTAVRQVVLRLTLAVEQAGERSMRRLTRSLLVFDRNAMDWGMDGGAAVASFVNGRDPQVASLAKGATAAVSEDDAPFGLAAALVEALRAVTYVKDPIHPFAPDALDFVRHPAETLAAGQGDCDDLTVLFASLAEAAGHDVLVVLTPGHVFAALQLGMSAERRALVALAPHAVLEHEGELWLPIEATELGRGFRGAWGAAERELAEVASAGVEPVVFRVSAVRDGYPAAGIVLGEGRDVQVDAKAARAEAQAALSARDHGLERERERLRAAGDPRSLNQLGVLLALSGQLEAAEQAFLSASEHSKANVAPANNLGAVALVREQPRRALDLLLVAADAAPDEPRVQLNAILAALAVGDERALDDLLLRLEPEVLRPFWARVRAFQALRGALGNRSLETALAERLAARGLAPPGPMLRAGLGSPNPWMGLVLWIP